MKLSRVKDLCLDLKESRKFQAFVSIIIIYSSIVIGVSSYETNSLLLKLIIYSDYLITLIFLLEISIRYFAEETTKSFFSDGWNVFDTIIVVASLVPSSVSESILVLRLLRLLRLLRIISFIPELRSVVENLIKALRKSIYILILIFIISYIYAVSGTQFFGEIDNAKFKYPVVPGDTLIFKCELLSPLRRGICHMRAQAFVDGKLTSEADLMAKIIRKTDT